MSDTIIQLTEDGSPTLFSQKFGETYHSRHGALNETNHVFITEGLLFKARNQKKIRVGEIGLGTFLNAWATMVAAREFNIEVDYYAIEPYPPDPSSLENYIKHIHSKDSDLYKKLIQIPENKVFESPFFRFQWQRSFWPDTDFLLPSDLIYYDAFAPGTQPELWGETAFSKAWDNLNSGGILVTYCAKGVVKRTLKNIGFLVVNPVGPKGKREMTRAIKP